MYLKELGVRSDVRSMAGKAYEVAPWREGAACSRKGGRSGFESEGEFEDAGQSGVQGMSMRSSRRRVPGG